MKTVEIRSNIAGDIMKIRKGVVFKEYATVVDELLQNCQRAKATEVEVLLDRDMLVIKDNGTGCADPQALLEKNTSAWMNEDEAFGEGFFSVFLIADMIKVRSYDWELTIDVLDMLETKNMNIEVIDGLEHVSGFIVELVGLTIEEQIWSLRDEVQELGRIMPMNVTLNGWCIEHKPLLELQSSEERLIDTDLFTAVLKPTTGWSVVEYFYENRPVRSDYMTGISGRIAIKKGCITLKAPDRKDFIYDNKRQALMSGVEEAAKKLYLDFVMTATDDDLNRYEDPIEYYLDVADYADILTVSPKLFQRSLLNNEKREQDEENEKDEVKYATEDMIKWIRQIETLANQQAAETRSSEEPKDIRRRRPSGLLKKLVEKEKRLVYVSEHRVEDFEMEIREAEYNGFVILYAKNKLYERAFEYYGIPSIETLKDVIDEDIVIERDMARSKKEKRFLALMQRVEQHYGMAPGSIRLANLRKEIRHKITGELLSSKYEEVHGLCDRQNGVIYIDRKIVKFSEYRAQKPEYPSITAHDYKVLLRVNQTLCHELAHLLYGFADNTVEHSQAMVKIGYEIAELF